MTVSRIQSLRVAAVLEDCSDQLDILDHTLTVKISREKGAAAAKERTRLVKLRGDCQYISEQFAKLHMELQEKQTFSSLQQVAEEQWKPAEELRREEKRALEQRQQTLEAKKEEFKEKNQKLLDMCLLVRDLECKVNEQSSIIAIRKRTAEKNIELKLQLAQKESSQAEKLLEDQLEILHKQLKEEARVHQVSEKFLKNQHEELQQLLQQWQQHTKQALQEKEQQLNNVCCKRTLIQDKLMEKRRQFREMEQVVMEEREELEKLRQQQEKARAATKLQAWWRGCMVRRGLGSFKKAEEKKGKKKKKKK